jgi:hypothetical protein
MQFCYLCNLQNRLSLQVFGEESPDSKGQPSGEEPGLRRYSWGTDSATENYSHEAEQSSLHGNGENVR